MFAPNLECTQTTTGMARQKPIQQFVKTIRRLLEKPDPGMQTGAALGQKLMADIENAAKSTQPQEAKDSFIGKKIEDLIVVYKPKVAFLQQAVEAVNASLKAVHAPPVKLIFSYLSPGTNAAMSFTNWTMEININNLLEAFNEDKVQAISSTIYHEARHAEQYFRMARRIAGRAMEKDAETKPTAAQIKYWMVNETRLGKGSATLPDFVIEEALKMPLYITPAQQKVRTQEKLKAKSRKIREADTWLEAHFKEPKQEALAGHGLSDRYKSIYGDLMRLEKQMAEARDAKRENREPKLPDNMQFPAYYTTAKQAYEQKKGEHDRAQDALMAQMMVGGGGGRGGGRQVLQFQIPQVGVQLQQELAATKAAYEQAKRRFLTEYYDEVELAFEYARQRYHNFSLEHDAHATQHDVNEAFRAGK